MNTKDFRTIAYGLPEMSESELRSFRREVEDSDHPQYYKFLVLSQIDLNLHNINDKNRREDFAQAFVATVEKIA